jgi:hypothetical protein
VGAGAYASGIYVKNIDFRTHLEVEILIIAVVFGAIKLYFLF